MARLILASSSPYRAWLLKRAGYVFDVISPTVEESVSANLTPSRAVMTVAMRKLDAVCARVGEGIVVAGDQAVEFEERIWEKPLNPKEAVDLLMKFRGKEHKLLTAMVVRECPSGRTFRHLDVHRIKMRTYSRAEVCRYVEVDRPLDCAGGLKIESMGVLLVEKVRGDDYTAIIGLPMMALTSILRKMGINPLSPLPTRCAGTPQRRGVALRGHRPAWLPEREEGR